MQLVHLDPRELVHPDRNVRHDVGDIEDLKASIRAHGILQPLVATTTDGGINEILIGHRRRQAAIELELPTVPTLVVESHDAAQRILKMLAENVHRQGLTATEESDAYQQLVLLEMSVDQIAAQAAKPIARIRASLALQRLPEAAQKAADSGQLTLSEAAELQEFNDDPKALAKVIERGNSRSGFAHAIAEERHRRGRNAAAEKLKAQLVLDGVKVLPKPKDWGTGGVEEKASTLLDRDGNALDPNVMKTKPGFAAFIYKPVYGQPEATIFCTDPEAWGYTRTRPSKKHKEAEEQSLKERQAALALAAEVRMDFVRQHYGVARNAKDVYLDALRDTVADPDAIAATGDNLIKLVGSVAGTQLFPTVHKAGADRLQRLLVGRWLATSERNLADIAEGRQWRSDREAATRYLDRLAAAGYQLSDAEQALRDELTANSDDTDEDGDEASEPSEDAATWTAETE
jgi:ParB family chromosome partitioning protein